METPAQPWHSNLTGNLIWLVVVATLCSIVIIPVVRGELSPEALNNLAIAAMSTLGALAMAAAGFVWRGKLERPSQTTTTPSTGDGSTTVIPPDDSSTTTTVRTDPNNVPS